MKRDHYISLLLLLSVVFTFVGCIENDVPYPVIKGKVEAVAFKGEKEVTIDQEAMAVNLILNDTVDIRRVDLTKLTVTPDAISTLKEGEVLDLTQPFKFSITTYQQYDWVINTTQPIDRKIKVQNQVGDAEIGVNTRTVRVKVSADQDLANINIIEMQLGPSRSTMLPNYKQIHNFVLPQKFIVTAFDTSQEWTVYVSHTQELVSTGEADPWAMFANLRGVGQTDNTNPGFEWHKSGETEWTRVPTEQVVVSAGVFTCKLTGLEPSTEYVYRAYITGQTGDEVTFTTEAIPPMPPNMDIDAWTQAGKTWFPNAVAENNYWATGNEGVTGAPVNKNSNTTPTDDAVSGKAARMETISVPLVLVAAGNLYTGTYKTNIGDPASSAVMGRPYTGRPTSFSGYYKYTPAKINIDKDKKHQDKLGQADACHIYITLENWGDATERPKNPIKIASAEVTTDQIVSAYTKFDLPITYLDRTLKPTHIVIVGTSSIYGNEFCGGVGSLLFLDQLSIGFE